jgi:hypothetical protein
MINPIMITGGLALLVAVCVADLLKIEAVRRMQPQAGHRFWPWRPGICALVRPLLCGVRSGQAAPVGRGRAGRARTRVSSGPGAAPSPALPDGARCGSPRACS